VRGFGDPRPAPLPNGKSVWYQPSNGGYVLPFRPDFPNLGQQFLNGTDHGWTSSHLAWNGGLYDQWVPNKGANTMAYLSRQDIPYHYALADAFTVCDAYHCSVMGPTDPNRYHLWTGWVGNDGQGGGPVISNAEAGYGWSTYPERLEKAGISWKVYQDMGLGLNANGYWGWTANPYIGNYGDNSLLYFFQYQKAAPGSPLYQGALTGTQISANPQQSLFEQLRADVLANRLPQVSWISAPEAFTEHANWPSNYGAWYTDQVLQALSANPEVWSKTVLFINFDENDGYFDHMPPPVPPMSPAAGLSTVDASNEIYPGDASNMAGPYGLGARVPMTVVSPWSKGGWVCSEVFDHTSLIRFIERRFGDEYPGIVESNITAWRRAVCGDLSSAFNFAHPRHEQISLPATTGFAPTDALRHPSVEPVPPTVQALPKQEKGLKKSRALPYAFEVDSRLDNSHRRIWIDFKNQGRAGAVFTVYTLGSAAAPRHYTVEAGKRLSDFWSTAQGSGVYDLLVMGPNGFTRRFAGDGSAAASAQSVAAELQCSSVVQGDDVALRLTLSNTGKTRLRLQLKPLAYSQAGPRSLELAPGASVVQGWSLEDSHGWYDLALTLDQSPKFLRRLAGRVETGRPSISDPAIATV